MINESHFHSSRHLGTWLKVLLRDGSLVRIRLFATPAEIELAAAYAQHGVAHTEPQSTPALAAQAAMDAIYGWRAQNPYSNLGAFVGVLSLPDGRFAGGYQTRWSAT
jgi:hypothetical protein